MCLQKSLTLREYYRSFKKLSGILAILMGIAPIGTTIPLETAEYLFPPLGNVTGPAKGGAILFAFVVTFIVFFAKDLSLSRIRRMLVFLLVSAVVSLCLYIGLHVRFVRQIPIPTRKSIVHVSVGWERTGFAHRNFGSKSDWDLLRERGLDEEQVSELWTWRSLLVARLGLFLSYCGVLLPLVGVFSLGLTYAVKQELGLPPLN